MKKTVFLAAMFSWLFVMSSFSQIDNWTRELRPLLKEGKVWMTKFPSYVVKKLNFPSDTCRYWIQGDTTISDVAYKKAYRQFVGGEAVYIGAVTEKDSNHKLLKVHPGETTPSLVYDLDESKFQSSYWSCTVQNMPEGEYQQEEIRRLTRREISIRETNYFRTEYTYGSSHGMIGVCSLYEEIGSEGGPFSLIGEEFLLSCYDGEKCIYQFNDEIKSATGIHSIYKEHLEQNGTNYDLQGRRITEPQKGKIYIQKGKKYINK